MFITVAGVILTNMGIRKKVIAKRNLNYNIDQKTGLQIVDRVILEDGKMESHIPWWQIFSKYVTFNKFYIRLCAC